ncbi:MAG: hypothetical protein N2450_00880 [bacterium]|nr:hypothetical protein [bacterium]
MSKDTVQITSQTVDVGNRKVVVFKGDTIADISITKSDTSPSILIKTPSSKTIEIGNIPWQNLIVPISFFIVAGFITYFFIKYAMRKNELRHQERMAAIEKGVPLLPDDPRAIQMITEDTKTSTTYNPYKWPLILSFVGAAFVIANIIEGDDWGFGLVLLALGIALYLANHLKEKRYRR